jgi:O-antigen/teichoic acid export membrane protein
MKKYTLFGYLNYAFLIIFSLWTLPKYINGLEEKEFAFLSLVWAVSGIGSLLDFGLGRNLTRLLAIIEEKKEETISLVTTGLIFSFRFIIPGSLILTFLLSLYISSTHIVDYDVMYFVIIFFILVFTVLVNLLFSILEGIFAIHFLTSVRFFSNFIFLFLPLLMVSFVLNDKLLVVLLALLFARALVFLIQFNYLYRNKYIDSSSYSEPLTYQLRASSIWLTLSNFTGLIFSQAERLLNGARNDAIVFNNYNIASDLIQRGVGVISVITNSLFPFLSNSQNNLEANKKLISFVYKTIFVIGFLVILFLFVRGEIILSLWLKMKSERLSMIYSILKILIFGWLFSGLGQLELTKLHSKGRFKETSILHLIELLIYFPLLWVISNFRSWEVLAYSWTLRCFVDWILLFILEKNDTRFSSSI